MVNHKLLAQSPLLFLWQQVIVNDAFDKVRSYYNLVSKKIMYHLIPQVPGILIKQMVLHVTSPVCGEINCFSRSTFCSCNTKYSSLQIGHGFPVDITPALIQVLLVFLGGNIPL